MKLSERSPGDKGYAAFWRQEFGRAAPAIKQLRNGEVSGRSIIAVMNVYGAEMNNTTGRSHLGQKALAEKSGTSVRVVKRVQQWAVDHGWQAETARAVPHVAGKTVVMTIGQVPNVGASSDSGACDAEAGANSSNSGASSDETGASTGQQTLITNSQQNSRPQRHPDIDKAPCFCMGDETCIRCAPKEKPEPCQNHPDFAARECTYCRLEPAPSPHPQWKLEAWHNAALAGTDGADESGTSPTDRPPFRPGSRGARGSRSLH